MHIRNHCCYVQIYNNDGLADLIEMNLSPMGRRMLVAQLGEVSTTRIISRRTMHHIIYGSLECKRPGDRNIPAPGEQSTRNFEVG